MQQTVGLNHQPHIQLLIIGQLKQHQNKQKQNNIRFIGIYRFFICSLLPIEG